jgi:hypothetical protein
MSTANEYNLIQYFQDGTWEYVRQNVSAEEAIMTSKRYVTSVAAKTGIVRRVMVTDGDDFCNFDWQYGRGIVFPTREECAVVAASSAGPDEAVCVKCGAPLEVPGDPCACGWDPCWEAYTDANGDPVSDHERVKHHVRAMLMRVPRRTP